MKKVLLKSFYEVKLNELLIERATIDTQCEILW